MNYQILAPAILTNLLIVFNSWAGCCFIGPNEPGPQVFKCITTDNNYKCEFEETDSIAYYSGTDSSCSVDGMTCCNRGVFPLVDQIEGFFLREAPIPNDCKDIPPGPGHTIILPIDIINFTANLETNGHVKLEGTALSYGNREAIEIWRAQIEDKKAVNLTRVGNPTLNAKEDYVKFDFLATDTNPLNGVNYYIPVEVDTSGNITPHCDHIQTIGKTPNLNLARILCEQQKILPLLQIFGP